jgi:hypothetical protein
LQQFLRIIQPVLELSFAAAQGLRSQRGDNLVPRVGGVFAHKSHFVDLDPRIALQRAAQLVDQRLGAAGCAAGGKGAHKLRQTGLRAGGREMDAGDSGIGEEARKAAFRRRGFQRHSVDVELSARGPQQQAGFPRDLQRGAEFLPGGFELRGRPRMTEFIQAGKLQQNVQTVYEPARHRGF